LTVPDVKKRPNANETNVINTQQIFMSLVSALTILVNPNTVEADANFLLIFISCFILLVF